MVYNHRVIEKKWQKYWDENKTFKTLDDYTKEKFYALDMFPYPSGAGLHVGHPEGYTATDILSRYKRANGYNVLHPMGWDAFGLPAEQYALDTGNDPREFTKKNIDTFRRQIKELGFSLSVRSSLWDSLTTGISRLIHVIRNIINGHNGFSKNFMKKGLLMLMKCL